MQRPVGRHCLALQVFGSEAGVLGNPRQHARADFLAIMEGEYEVGPATRASVRCEPV